MEKIIVIEPEISFEEEEKEQNLLLKISEIRRKSYPERIKQEQEFRKLTLQLENLTITPYISGKLPITPYRLEKLRENLPKKLRKEFYNKDYMLEKRVII